MSSASSGAARARLQVLGVSGSVCLKQVNNIVFKPSTFTYGHTPVRCSCSVPPACPSA